MLRSPDTKIKCSSDTDLTKAPVGNEEQNITSRKRKQPELDYSQAIIVRTITEELKNTLNEWRCELDARMSTITDNVVNIKSDLATLTQATTEIRNEIHSLRSEQSAITQRIDEQEEKYNQLSLELTELQKSTQYQSDQQIDIERRVDTMLKQNQNVADLQNTVVGLVAKIDAMEQSARQCNIELCNIPEKRNENLLSILENIGSKINYSISQKDIIAIHRVPHAQENGKPKNIIVKFTSRILRDNILSACRLSKDLNAEMLGFPNSSLPIRIHEHLTLKTKQLFRECKSEAVKYNYKFVWVRHGTILVRKKEGARAIAVKCHEELGKLKPKPLIHNQPSTSPTVSSIPPVEIN